MSFGMLFSIILIMIFIFFAFSIIGKFLDTGDKALVKQFVNEVQRELDSAWRSEKTFEGYSDSIPKKIDKICLADFNANPSGDDIDIYNELKMKFYETENLFFYPVDAIDGLEAETLEHIDITTTTEISNPLCIDNIDGDVSYGLQKNYKDTLVKITR